MQVRVDCLYFWGGYIPPEWCLVFIMRKVLDLFKLWSMYMWQWQDTKEVHLFFVKTLVFKASFTKAGKWFIFQARSNLALMWAWRHVHWGHRAPIEHNWNGAVPGRTWGLSSNKGNKEPLQSLPSRDEKRGKRNECLQAAQALFTSLTPSDYLLYPPSHQGLLKTRARLHCLQISRQGTQGSPHPFQKNTTSALRAAVACNQAANLMLAPCFHLRLAPVYRLGLDCSSDMKAVCY